MSRNAVIALAIGAGLVIAAGSLYLSPAPASGLPASRAELIGFTVMESNFVALGRGLSKVEVRAVPPGTGAGGSEYALLGEAKLTAGTSTLQTWTLAVPDHPMPATQIFARGFGPSGMDAGVIFLPYSGMAALYDALWPQALP